MSTIAEIEAPIERLADQELKHLAQWAQTLRIRPSTPQAADIRLQRAKGVLADRAATAPILSLTRNEA